MKNLVNKIKNNIKKQMGFSAYFISNPLKRNSIRQGHSSTCVSCSIMNYLNYNENTNYTFKDAKELHKQITGNDNLDKGVSNRVFINPLKIAGLKISKGYNAISLYKQFNTQFLAIMNEGAYKTGQFDYNSKSCHCVFCYKLDDEYAYIIDSNYSSAIRMPLKQFVLALEATLTIEKEVA